MTLFSVHHAYIQMILYPRVHARILPVLNYLNLIGYSSFFDLEELLAPPEAFRACMMILLFYDRFNLDANSCSKESKYVGGVCSEVCAPGT